MTDRGTAAPPTHAGSSEAASLVRMANQIASNVAHEPHDVAVRHVAAHLHDFWHPSMRAGLMAYVDAGGDGLGPIALEALNQLR